MTGFFEGFGPSVCNPQHSPTPSPNSGVSVCQSVHEPHLLQVAV